MDVSIPLDEANDPERVRIITELSNKVDDDEVDSAVWASLWICDLKPLQKLVDLEADILDCLLHQSRIAISCRNCQSPKDSLFSV